MSLTQVLLWAARLISNLEYNVSDEDIQELFMSIGPIKRAGIDYDQRWIATLCLLCWDYVHHFSLEVDDLLGASVL